MLDPRTRDVVTSFRTEHPVSASASEPDGDGGGACAAGGAAPEVTDRLLPISIQFGALVTMDLKDVTARLEQLHDAIGWGLSPQLYAVFADGSWLQLSEGDPYDMLEDFAQCPDLDAEAVALTCEGWAAPYGISVRPSVHPARRRVRSVVSVGRSGERWSAIRQQGDDVLVTAHGAGPLFEAMAQLWGVDGPAAA